jgi:hypothetical protein
VSGPLAVFVGVVTLFLVGRQIRTMRTSERAWIMITSVQGDLSYPPVEFKGAVRNSGKTLARIVETAIRYLPIAELSELAAIPEYEKTTPRNGMIIVPQDSFPLAVETRSLGKISYVSGLIVYRDVYGNKKETQFGFAYDFESREWKISDPPGYNRAT